MALNNFSKLINLSAFINLHLRFRLISNRTVNNSFKMVCKSVARDFEISIMI